MAPPKKKITNNKTKQSKSKKKASNGFAFSNWASKTYSVENYLTEAQKKSLEEAKKAKARKDAEKKRKEAAKKVEPKKVESKKPNQPFKNPLTEAQKKAGINVPTVDSALKAKKAKEAAAKKEAEKKSAERRKTEAPKVKSDIERLQRPGQQFKTEKPKPVTPKPVTPKPVKTVSQLWQEKTGTSWSEAKKQGLTDGTASANIALMKKLQSGSVNKDSVKISKIAGDMSSYKKDMEQNIKDELSGKISFEAPKASDNTNSELASGETKMRKGGMIKRKMQDGGIKKASGTKKVIGMNPTSRSTAMKALGINNKSQYSPSKFNDNVTSYARSTGTKKMKTGGMVNRNSKVSALKSAGSNGVRSGSNTRVSASKVARGRVGGTSAAPRTATPKAKYGMSFGIRKRR